MLALGMAGSRDSDDVALSLSPPPSLSFTALLLFLIFLASNYWLPVSGRGSGCWRLQANNTLSSRWEKGALPPAQSAPAAHCHGAGVPWLVLWEGLVTVMGSPHPRSQRSEPQRKGQQCREVWGRQKLQLFSPLHCSRPPQ